MIAQQISLPDLFTQWLEPPYESMQDLQAGTSYLSTSLVGAVTTMIVIGMFSSLIGSIARGN